MSKPTTETQAQQAAKPVRKSLAERRAEKAEALLRRNAVDAARAEIRGAADLIKTYARLEDWDQVRDQIDTIIGHVDALDPQTEGEPRDDEAGQ